MEYLVYGKYIYGKRTRTQVIVFKDRNGFERVDIPKYYIPLTLKGRVLLTLRLHHGVAELFPERIISFLIGLRTKWYGRKFTKSQLRPVGNGGE